MEEVKDVVVFANQRQDILIASFERSIDNNEFMLVIKVNPKYSEVVFIQAVITGLEDIRNKLKAEDITDVKEAKKAMLETDEVNLEELKERMK